MDQPVAKKRRLAPKEPPQPPASHAQAYAHEASQPAQHYQAQEAVLPPPERHEFESFARHLQDAAMLIFRQSQKSQYKKVSVLFLRWEEDDAVDQDLALLEQVFRELYNYRTERWNIPSVPNVSLQLGVRVSSFLEAAGKENLVIVYYAGYGNVNVDNQLYWASNSGKDATKVKWNGIRCLFEDIPSDVLVLLDSCAAEETQITTASGLKQIVAANTPEQGSRESGMPSFTRQAVEVLTKLRAGRPFTVELLCQEIAQLKRQQLEQHAGLTNGASKSIAAAERPLVSYNLSPAHTRSITLTPLDSESGAYDLVPPRRDADGEQQTLRAPREDAIHPNAVSDLVFDEQRVLVCTTFVGEASPDMSSFNQWLQQAPAIASRIAVEGVFLGPPTMLLISMPAAVWNIVQHDKVCCFLGQISSHNMTHLYERLVRSVSVNRASAKDMEDGRMLLEAREAAVASPAVRRHEFSPHEPNHHQAHPKTPVRTELPQASASSLLPFANSASRSSIHKEDVEESAEMKEAAEQLKALSHVRHLSDEIPSSVRTKSSHVEVDRKLEDASSPGAIESAGEEMLADSTPSSKIKSRKSQPKVPTPRQETRCNHCSHAPFKDSSSLRKHIAAAHTRPFPCAFAFAGCTSTFGSKNEWKRHIASQHLCLQYYRCSQCPKSTVEGKGNEFNRKDLFTQHLRRMHAPFAIKKAIAKGDSKLQVEWEAHVKDMQQSCLVTRRQPPQRSACPKPDCASVFEGPTSWDEWTEHVGRHMEKGEAARLGVDRLLAKWALEEGIIERKDDGEYRLVMGGGPQDEKGATGLPVDPDENTIIAASTLVEPMDVDG